MWCCVQHCERQAQGCNIGINWDIFWKDAQDNIQDMTRVVLESVWLVSEDEKIHVHSMLRVHSPYMGTSLKLNSFITCPCFHPSAC